MALFKCELKIHNWSSLYDIMMSGGQKAMKTLDINFTLVGRDDITKEASMGKCEG